MQRTLWTLILAITLQLFAGSSWALHAPTGNGTVVHCHEGMAQDDATPTHNATTDSHHCCAVGLGVGVQPVLPSLPQVPPAIRYGSWVSQSVRPDLPPPI